MFASLIAAALVLTIEPVIWDDTAEREAVIRREVAEKLRDPQSAYFRDVQLRQTETGTRIVCGWVSGRNGYGGMGEALPFHYTGAATVHDMPAGDGHFDERTRELSLKMHDFFCGETSSAKVRDLDWSRP